MPVFIPLNCQSTEMADIFRSFVNDFCKGIKNKEPGAWGPDAFWIKYLSQEHIYDNKQIAEHLPVKKDRERVRQVLTAYEAGILGMLEDGTEFKGMLPSQEMKTAFDRFRGELKPVEQFNLLLRRYGFGDQDADILLCMLDCLDYDIFRDKDIDPYAISRKTFGRALTVLKRHISPLSKHLRNTPVPRCYETDVLPFMVRKNWNVDLQRLMKEFLKADEHEYEWFGPDDLDHTWVAKRWEALGGEDKRVERILYDHYQSPNQTEGWMNLKEIRKQYDHLADLHRLPHLSPNPSFGGEHTESRGNGDCRYSVNPRRIEIDMHLELRSYMAKRNGLSSLADALAFANTKRTCSESLVRRYLNEIGCIGGSYKGQSGYYCRKEDLDKYPVFVPREVVQVTAGEVIEEAKKILIKENRPLHINNELIPRFEEGTGKQIINNVSFRNLLKKADGVLFEFPGGGMICLGIPIDQAKEFDVDTFWGNKKSGSQQKTREGLVQEVAAEKLLAVPGYTMKKKALCDAVIEEGAYPKDKNVTNVYQYLNDSLFISNGNGRGSSYTLNIREYNKRFGFVDSFNWNTLKTQIVVWVNDSRLDAAVAEKMYSIMEDVAVKPFDNSCEMWRILKMVSGYLNGKPTTSDKELLVFKLQVGLEGYLKQYAGDHYNKDGLGTFIQSLQVNNKFPAQSGKYSAGTIEHDIDALTGKMIDIRNKICHRLNEGYNKETFYGPRIKESLKYYLLVAAYAMKRGL